MKIRTPRLVLRGCIVWSTLLCATFFTHSTYAEGVEEDAPIIERYRAEFANADRFNSLGRRLFYLHQVVEQDRANVHSFNLSQFGDEVDTIFGDYAQRRKLALAILESGATKLLSDQFGEKEYYVITVYEQPDGKFSATVEAEELVAASRRVHACTMEEIERGRCNGVKF